MVTILDSEELQCMPKIKVTSWKSWKNFKRDRTISDTLHVTETQSEVGLESDYCIHRAQWGEQDPGFSLC